MSEIASKSFVYRDDIQFWRGIAVLLVVLYHLKIPGFSLGFLGVDFFFVISGFVITNQILKLRANHSFTYSDFLKRRVVRLLPANMVVAIVSLVLFWFWMEPELQYELLKSFLWYNLLQINHYFAFNLNYFSSSADLNPFLHMWSLAVEEQFYLLFPLVFVLFGGSRYLIKVLMAIAVISFVLYLILFFFKSNLAFFSILCRSWQLLIGALLALCLNQHVLKWKYTVSVFIAFFGMFLYLNIDLLNSLTSVFIVVPASLLLLSRLPVDNLFGRIFVHLGNLSYSVYLVHWPVIVFFNVGLVDLVSDSRYQYFYTALALVLTLLFSWLLYVLIERPMRHHVNWYKYYLTFALASLLLAIGFNYANNKSDSTVIKSNHGLSVECNQYGPFSIPSKCIVGSPSVVLWGDSYAMSWASGLKTNLPGTGFIQLTRAGCSPMVGLAQMNRSYNPSWARNCLNFQSNVLEFIMSQQSIKTVILSSPFGLSVKEDNLILNHDSLGYQLSFASDSLGLHHLLYTIKMLSSADKKVIVLGPTPSDGANRGRCFSRIKFNLESLHDNNQCTIDRTIAESRDALLRWSFQDSIRGMNNVLYISLYKYLCTQASCMTIDDDQNLYVDDGHLSHYGSTFVWNQIKPEVDRFMEE
jgi:peptidoglycan/LPS O-acetylase OafA/YrhL